MRDRTPRLIALGPIPPDLRAVLAERYPIVDCPATTLNGTQAAPGHDVAVTMSVHGVSAALMERLPDLALIACNGAGLERIDLAAARRRGIAVCHTPDELAEDVAECAIALVYAIMRRVVEADRFVRAGRWSHDRMAPTRRLAGKSIGVVGLGRFGTLVAQRAQAIGMRPAYFAPRPKSFAPGPQAPWPFVADLPELAQRSDVLVLCCPGGEATRNLVGRAVLDRLGRDGYLVNVARGSVVDEPALISALEEGRIAGAALDVFATEPALDPRFLALENVVLQPHSASITRETRAAMLARLTHDIAAFAEGLPFHDAAARA
jgi:hydroxypyruvate reductase